MAHELEDLFSPIPNDKKQFKIDDNHLFSEIAVFNKNNKDSVVKEPIPIFDESHETVIKKKNSLIKNSIGVLNMRKPSEISSDKIIELEENKNISVKI